MFTLFCLHCSQNIPLEFSCQIIGVGRLVRMCERPDLREPGDTRVARDLVLLLGDSVASASLPSSI